MFEEIEYEILNFEFPISKQFLNVSNAQCPEKGFCLPARIVTRSVSGGCKRVLTRGNPGHCQILDRRGFSSTKILAMTTTGIRLRKEGFPCLFRMPDAPENAFEKNFEIPFPKSKGFENPHDTIRSFLPPAPLQGSSLRGCNHPWQSRVLLCHAVALAEAELCYAVALAEAELCHAGVLAEMGFLFFLVTVVRKRRDWSCRSRATGLDCFVEDSSQRRRERGRTRKDQGVCSLLPAPLQGPSLRGCNHPWQSRVLPCYAVALAEAELCHAGVVAEATPGLRGRSSEDFQPIVVWYRFVVTEHVPSLRG